EENFRQSLRISRETGHLQGEAMALLAIGLLCRRRRQSQRAEEQFRRALALANQVGAQREALLAREFLGELALDRGDGAEALAQFEPALEAARGLAPQRDLVAELETRTGRAATLYRQLGVVPLAAESLLVLGRLEAERERYDQALGLLEQAEQWLSEDRDPETEDRAGSLRRELERQYVAVSLSTCNEFRA